MSTSVSGGPPSTVRAFIAPAIAAATVSFLAAALAAFPETQSWAGDAWLLGLAVVAVWATSRALGRALPVVRRTAFDEIRAVLPDDRAERDHVRRIQWALIDAEASGLVRDAELRTIVRRTARSRLIERRQVDLDIEPERARALLGDDVWELCGAGGDPDRGRAVQIPRARVRHAVEVLEAL